jgi:hypothetical protein
VLIVGSSNLRSRLQKVAQADTVQHLGANAIEHCEADIAMAVIALMEFLPDFLQESSHPLAARPGRLDRPP